ncbi:DUF3718 domain-containing protein [Pseudidiomarina homiensis]|nr:DUF3718 domain-containing protein [Pseudidiomarina homiensis]
MAITMLTAPAQPAYAQYRFASEEIALVFCAYVRDNDTSRLQNKMRELRIRMRDVYSSIRCNGASLIQFALKTNSHDVGSFIVRSVPLNDLRDAGDYEWALENGYGDTVIGQALSDRQPQPNTF